MHITEFANLLREEADRFEREWCENTRTHGGSSTWFG